MNNRIIFVACLIFVLLILVFEKPNYKCANCNIILISVDSVRYDHLGINGYSRNTTPNIDNFARDSIFFPNYITQAYLTPISEASIHTSRYPSSNGFVGFIYYLDPQSTKLEDVLKYYGYNNYAFVGSGNFFGDGTFVNQFSPSYKVYRRTYESDGFPLNISELKNFTKEKFFLWISIGNIHWPYGVPNAPQKYVDMFVDKNYSGLFKNQTLDGEVVPRIKGWDITSNDRQYIIDNYDSGLKYSDDYIGELLQGLKENDLIKNTIIVIQSEHGEELGDHGRFTHNDIWENTIHTFLIINNPALKDSKTILTQAQGIDIMPTILDMVDIPIPESAQGKSLISLSLISLIFGKADLDFNKYAFTERIPYPSFFPDIINTRGENAIPIKVVYDVLSRYNQTDALQDLKNTNNSFYEHISVRTNDWKLIERPYQRINDVSQLIYTYSKKCEEENKTYCIYPNFFVRVQNYSSYQLFNLKNDPNEQNDLYGRNLSIETELIRILNQWKESRDSSGVQYIFNSSVFVNYTFN